jgi:hypothetical protein
MMVDLASLLSEELYRCQRLNLGRPRIPIILQDPIKGSRGQHSRVNGAHAQQVQTPRTAN